MLMPSIFGENLFDDDWMNFPFEQDFWGKKNPLYGKHAKNMMKTDIREHDAGYEVDIDLPGFKKDEISIELEKGYLLDLRTKRRGLHKPLRHLTPDSHQCSNHPSIAIVFFVSTGFASFFGTDSLRIPFSYFALISSCVRFSPT